MDISEHSERDFSEYNEDGINIKVTEKMPLSDPLADLRAYMSAVFPAFLEPFPAEIVERFVPYLGSLTEEITPPPPGLIGEALDHLSNQAVRVDGLPSFAEVRTLLETKVFPLVELTDFEPLSPDGVTGFISKLVSNRPARSNLEKVLFAIFQAAKRAKFILPRNRIRSFRREGPFELLAIDDRMITAQLPLTSIYNYAENNRNEPIRSNFISASDTFDAPKEADFATIDLSGFSMLYTNGGPMTITLSNAQQSNTYSSQLSVFNDSLQDNSCHTSIAFNPLLGPRGLANVTFLPTLTDAHRDRHKDFWFVGFARVNIRYYAARLEFS